MLSDLNRSQIKSAKLVFTELQGVLILTFPPSCGFLDHELKQMKQSTLQRCAQKQYQAVIFDLSALELIDLSEWTSLRSLSHSITLMGPKSWFTGLSSDIVMSLIHLEAPTQDLHYALSVEEALNLTHHPLV